MMRLAPVLVRFSLVPRWPGAPGVRRARRSARRAVAFGVLAFGLVTLALETAAETNRPQWRDPEYGHRLNRARVWQA
ncbi:MAG TPA: hypothetical protein VGE74_24010, partial [Gemmata sp.]